MTETSAREIAASLSEAQKRAVLWCNVDGSMRLYDKSAPREVSFFCLQKVIKGDPTIELATMFSLVKFQDHPTVKSGLWPARMWALTPLGAAVRAILQEQANVR